MWDEPRRWRSVFNHATLNYSDGTIDAWIARFDNVATALTGAGRF